MKIPKNDGMGYCYDIQTVDSVSDSLNNAKYIDKYNDEIDIKKINILGYVAKALRKKYERKEGVGKELLKNVISISDDYSAIKDSENIILLNDVGYYLYLNKEYVAAKHVLRKVEKLSPDRLVMYVNLADVLWELNERVEALRYYQIYVNEMSKQGKELRIPKYVYSRIK
ncbi:hypothetical protein WH50_20850 [Pokkaliibacter plantistimulans]|uniref:Tetratricopeptide repeat protein n=2 Tax=Pokkaliibacter plantistimulans TaxID=1635171 RepID=A0ABX5LS28_9GAMM|nr:hypothetical protein WH50_20850 [Pokkaliibacter plantistimulans]